MTPTEKQVLAKRVRELKELYRKGNTSIEARLDELENVVDALIDVLYDITLTVPKD